MSPISTPFSSAMSATDFPSDNASRNAGPSMPSISSTAAGNCPPRRGPELRSRVGGTSFTFSEIRSSAEANFSAASSSVREPSARCSLRCSSRSATRAATTVSIAIPCSAAMSAIDFPAANSERSVSVSTPSAVASVSGDLILPPLPFPRPWRPSTPSSAPSDERSSIESVSTSPAALVSPGTPRTKPAPVPASNPADIAAKSAFFFMDNFFLSFGSWGILLPLDTIIERVFKKCA